MNSTFLIFDFTSDNARPLSISGTPSRCLHRRRKFSSLLLAVYHRRYRNPPESSTTNLHNRSSGSSVFSTPTALRRFEFDIAEMILETSQNFLFGFYLYKVMVLKISAYLAGEFVEYLNESEIIPNVKLLDMKTMMMLLVG